MTTKTITEYMAAITIPGMSLWTAGYLVGLLIGVVLAPVAALVFTLGLTTTFALFRLYAVRKHGVKVAVVLSEELVRDIIKE